VKAYPELTEDAFLVDVVRTGIGSPEPGDLIMTVTRESPEIVFVGTINRTVILDLSENIQKLCPLLICPDSGELVVAPWETTFTTRSECFAQHVSLR
jgi:hypothetical protein